MRTEIDLTEEDVEDPLTGCVLLSQVAGMYDPVGLVTPMKQKGVNLVRRSFQEDPSGWKGKPWGTPFLMGAVSPMVLYCNCDG